MSSVEKEEQDPPRVDNTDDKPLPGPNDWGYRYSPSHQRDPHSPFKPLAR